MTVTLSLFLDMSFPQLFLQTDKPKQFQEPVLPPSQATSAQWSAGLSSPSIQLIPCTNVITIELHYYNIIYYALYCGSLPKAVTLLSRFYQNIRRRHQGFLCFFVGNLLNFGTLTVLFYLQSLVKTYWTRKIKQRNISSMLVLPQGRIAGHCA